MDYYLAGRFGARDKLRDIRDRITLHRSVASWLDVAAREEDVRDSGGRYIGAVCREYAQCDLRDIAACDVFVLVDDGEPSSGGRHVELGYALALGKHVVRVGPGSNIFAASLPDVSLETVEECLSYLACGFTF